MIFLSVLCIQTAAFVSVHISGMMGYKSEIFPPLKYEEAGVVCYVTAVLCGHIVYTFFTHTNLTWLTDKNSKVAFVNK
jgi:hypothetical protein